MRDPVKNNRRVVNSFLVSFACSLLLLMCCSWLLVETLNASSFERNKMIHYVSGIISSFILFIWFVIMSQMVQVWGTDTGQVGRHYSHLVSK
jgi:hypothetical protein